MALGGSGIAGAGAPQPPVAGAPQPGVAAGPLALGAEAPQPLGEMGGAELAAGAAKLLVDSQPVPKAPRPEDSTGSVAVCRPGPGRWSCLRAAGSASGELLGRLGSCKLSLTRMGLTFWVVADSVAAVD